MEWVSTGPDGSYATVAGGLRNGASGAYSSVGGGNSITEVDTYGYSNPYH